MQSVHRVQILGKDPKTTLYSNAGRGLLPVRVVVKESADYCTSQTMLLTQVTPMYPLLAASLKIPESAKYVGYCYRRPEGSADPINNVCRNSSDGIVDAIVSGTVDAKEEENKPTELSESTSRFLKYGGLVLFDEGFVFAGAMVLVSSDEQREDGDGHDEDLAGETSTDDDGSRAEPLHFADRPALHAVRTC